MSFSVHLMSAFAHFIHKAPFKQLIHSQKNGDHGIKID